MMPKKDLEYFEKRLLEERARVLKQLGYYENEFKAGDQASDGDLSSYSFHMADQGTDAMEREKSSSSRRRKAGTSGTSTTR
jgi:RNA polymerase-binding transcription factor DksA